MEDRSAELAGRTRGGGPPNDLPDDPGRVVIVARELTRGGAAYLALRHARRLVTRRVVDVVLTGPSDPEFVAEFPPEVSVFRLKPSRLDLSRPAAECLSEFAREHGDDFPFQRRYATLLATSTFPDLTASAAVCTLRAARKAVFLVDESLAFYPTLGETGQAIVAASLESADLIFPVSRRLRERLAEECPPLRGRPWGCLRPPVDRDEVRRLAARPQTTVVPGAVPNVLTVGRLAPEKQYLRCLRVHHELKRRGVRFRWYVVGEGPDEPALRAAIAELGMGDDFVPLGRRDDVFALMRACDVFALFSVAEGCPTVVLEALALGRPTVMTDVNGADEMLDHGRTGWVVANQPDAIAEGLARLVLDRDLRHRMTQALAGREPAEAPEPPLLDWAAPVARAPSPLVTVLIPTYNQEQTVGRAIASALAQTDPALEVVVLDDASTDGTGRVARAWESDPRFRYARNERNLGRVGNYRRGLADHARGDWVLMLDGDDELSDPGFLALARGALERQGDRPIVFAQAGHRVRHADGRHRDVDVLPPIAGDEAVLPGAAYLRLVFQTGFFTHLGALYRRDAALRAGFYTADLSSSDMDSLLRLALRGEVLLLNTVAGHWVQHGGNASARLPLDAFARNVRLFGRIARQAVREGLAARDDLAGPLTSYQARTLLYLFDGLRERTPQGPLGLARFLVIALRVNPRLFREPGFRAAVRRYAREEAEHSAAGRCAWSVLRGVRSALSRSRPEARRPGPRGRSRSRAAAR